MKKSKPLTSEAQAFRYALWLLGRRAYSSAELHEKMARRDLAQDLSDQVIQKLKDKRFLDDASFAEIFVRNRKDRHWGPRKIETALWKKKVPGDLIGRALALCFPRDQEAREAADWLARQKGKFMRKKEKKPGEARRKAWESLVRRGYSVEAARLAVGEVFGYNPGLPVEDPRD